MKKSKKIFMIFMILTHFFRKKCVFFNISWKYSFVLPHVHLYFSKKAVLLYVFKGFHHCFLIHFPVPFWIHNAQKVALPKGGVAMCWSAHYFYTFYLMYAIFFQNKCFCEIEVFCFGSLHLRLFLPTFTRFCTI